MTCVRDYRRFSREQMKIWNIMIKQSTTILLSIIVAFIISPLNAANIIDELPCAGYETRSDDSSIYGSGSGNDMDSLTSLRKAKLIARQRIASQIETIVNNTTEIYITSLTNGNIIETKEYLHTTASTISKQLLVGCNMVCQNTTKTSEQQFVSSVAIELPTKNITTSFEDQSTSHNIDWTKYREILNLQIRKEP